MIDIINGAGDGGQRIAAMVRQYKRFGIDKGQGSDPRLPHAALSERRDPDQAGPARPGWLVCSSGVRPRAACTGGIA